MKRNNKTWSCTDSHWYILKLSLYKTKCCFIENTVKRKNFNLLLMDYMEMVFQNFVPEGNKWLRYNFILQPHIKAGNVYEGLCSSPIHDGIWNRIISTAYGTFDYGKNAFSQQPWSVSVAQHLTSLFRYHPHHVSDIGSFSWSSSVSVGYGCIWGAVITSYLQNQSLLVASVELSEYAFVFLFLYMYYMILGFDYQMSNFKIQRADTSIF